LKRDVFYTQLTEICSFKEIDVLLFCYSVEMMEKNVVISANDTAAPPVVSPPSAPLHAQKNFPTPSGITEAEAKIICQAPILQSPLFAVCENFTKQSLDVISDSCMTDLLV